MMEIKIYRCKCIAAAIYNAKIIQCFFNKLMINFNLVYETKHLLQYEAHHDYLAGYSAYKMFLVISLTLYPNAFGKIAWLRAFEYQTKKKP